MSVTIVKISYWFVESIGGPQDTVYGRLIEIVDPGSGLKLKIDACPGPIGRKVQRGHWSLVSLNGQARGVRGMEPEWVGAFHFAIRGSKPVGTKPTRA
jgi:hypothetical protein